MIVHDLDLDPFYNATCTRKPLIPGFFDIHAAYSTTPSTALGPATFGTPQPLGEFSGNMAFLGFASILGAKTAIWQMRTD